MSSKRNLKKNVRYVCGDLAAECIIARNVVPDIDHKAMDGLVIEVARLQQNALKKISFSYDKTASDFATVAQYNRAKGVYMRKAFKSLKHEFNHEVNKIVKQMNAALPQAYKDAAKKQK